MMFWVKEKVVIAGELGSLNKIKLSQGWVRLSKESSQGPSFGSGCMMSNATQRKARAKTAGKEKERKKPPKQPRNEIITKWEES